jgi:hypothetical protein
MPWSWWVRENITSFLLWCLIRTNRCRDRSLSQRLFDIAESYNTRPGEMNYGKTIRDWEFNESFLKTHNSPKVSELEKK